MEKILVLLVDDQPMVAEGVRRMLAKDATIAFHYVSDPTQAIEMISKLGPTVILQDLVMPGVNGLDLLKEYRTNPFSNAIPVIVLSSKDDAAIKQLAFESGANDYMVKLPNPIELLARVRMHSEAYLHDLERQRAYRALEASQRELTANNLELVLLNEKLEESTRFKAEFFANVSHEIRTPLIGVIGVTEMLADTNLDSEQSELLEVVRTSGETLLHIINDILDLSKIESGKMELEANPFVLRDVLDQGMDLLAPIAFAKGLEISAWIDPRIASTVIGDITRVRQIVLNLLNNAIKFTSEGEIYLQVEPWGEGGDIIHFWVEDTGVGIPPEKLDRLFKSFSQVDASTTRRFGGTGLGLSICRNLTALMGGKIWVESLVGKRTVFHFVISLPAADIQEKSLTGLELAGKRLALVVKNTRLYELLSGWGRAVGLEISGSPDNGVNGGPGGHYDFLVLDADQKSVELSDFNPEGVILLTRSKNIAQLRRRYPSAIVLSLPLKKSRFLKALGVLPAGVPFTGPTEEVLDADPSIRGLNVLVVDDNRVSRRVCVSQLQRIGVRNVLQAQDGREAIVMAQSEVFDLIFMDVQMPEIDGIEATQQIRLVVSELNQPRIVGMTANLLNEEREKCLAAGMNDTTSKPATAEQLKALLNAAKKTADVALV
jgi:signal transduction histidine kinase